MPRQPLRLGSLDQADTDTRQRLLSAASEEFIEHGLRAAKIASICRRANLANGTFYLHFRTKEEPYLELVGRAAGELVRREDVKLRRNEIDSRDDERIITRESVKRP